MLVREPHRTCTRASDPGRISYSHKRVDGEYAGNRRKRAFNRCLVAIDVEKTTNNSGANKERVSSEVLKDSNTSVRVTRPRMSEYFVAILR